MKHSHYCDHCFTDFECATSICGDSYYVVCNGCNEGLDGYEEWLDEKEKL